MWKVRPAQTCFGCLTLLAGVELTCFMTLVIQILLISLCSSAEPLSILNLRVSSEIQVLCASWALVGIPLNVCAGVGVLYHIDHLLRTFFWYLLLSFPLGIGIPVWLLLTGKVCDSMVEEELQRMGSAFVCGFTETFVFMWTNVAAMLHAYLVYVVWSAAEEAAEITYSAPSLKAYSDKLQFMASLAPQRAAPQPATSMGMDTPLMSLLAAAAAAKQEPTPFSATDVFLPESAAPAGSPQSFFPMPSSEVDYGTSAAPQPQSFFPSPPSDVDFGKSATPSSAQKAAAQGEPAEQSEKA
eukprot:TRINITY_DN36083_c0_g1_i1.p1 TRINITY_DN36083_c0_g1~~TRINITY_DN36083_c0_g1_i1.p1  ORF type:complete len:327 (+),score=69.58 TRINITY_DN36083_c0_g1_i1:88-981(+)